VGDRRLLADPSFRAVLVDALRRAGELCIVVCYARSAGAKDWYLVRDDGELEAVLARIPATGQWGFSDRLEAYATDEFPERAAAADESLREKAAETLSRTGEVILACRREGDPELHDVEVTDDPDDVDEWFRNEYEGERLVGPHPFRHDGDPDAAFFVVYNLGADGTIRPGAY
jgi:hypothetical protein